MPDTGAKVKALSIRHVTFRSVRKLGSNQNTHTNTHFTHNTKMCVNVRGSL